MIWHAMRAENFMTPQPFEWKVDEILSYMDYQGIAMQMLSNLPNSHAALRSSNDYGATLVKQHPTRFGLLAALPTDDATAAMKEVERSTNELDADGFAVHSSYNGVYLGDASLEPLWEMLNGRKGTVVFVHPNAYAPSVMGRPTPLIEVAFETTRIVVDMLYNGVFRRYPNITWVLAHCGGALPALSGRLLALGNEDWAPNPEKVSIEEMKEQLARLYLDTTATATSSMLLPALEMTGGRGEHIVYGSDCGVPCSNERTLNANVERLLAFEGLTAEEKEAIGHGLKTMFPKAAERIGQGRSS
jgi:predicted TIM-barrel fold metal-dependent hydrolase